MLRFYAGVFVVVMRGLAGAVDNLVFVVTEGGGAERFVEYRHLALDELKAAVAEVEKLPIHRTLRWKLDDLVQNLEADDCLYTVADVVTLLKEVHNDIVRDLSTAYFLMIPESRRSFYDQRYSQPFGDTVAERFPDARIDIASAARCIALDEWTAAVFHLMRVLEHGLWDLAVRVGVRDSAALELQNWRNVIDQIEKAIRDLEQMPRSAEKVEMLRAYSAAATQLTYFKDAWRNHVSHSRAHYDEGEALNVWNHVRQFMQQLAAQSG